MRVTLKVSHCGQAAVLKQSTMAIIYYSAPVLHAALVCPAESVRNASLLNIQEQASLIFLVESVVPEYADSILPSL